VNDIGHFSQVRRNLVPHPQFMVKSPAIVTHCAICDRRHGNTTLSYPAVMLDQISGNSPFLTHTFKATGPDNPVSQTQTIDFSL
jgi:hypothetical protein